MAETTSKIKKNLSYDDKVIKKIAGIATDGVPGVLTLSGGLIGNIADKFRSSDDKTKGIDAEVGQKQVALDLNVVCEYGKNVPQLFEAIIEKVSSAILDMTGLEVVEVNMHVEDVLSHKEFEDSRKSGQGQSNNHHSSANSANADHARVQ